MQNHSQKSVRSCFEEAETEHLYRKRNNIECQTKLLQWFQRLKQPEPHMR